MKKTIVILLAALTLISLFSSCSAPENDKITQPIASNALTASSEGQSSTVMLSLQETQPDAASEPLPTSGDTVAISTPEPAPSDAGSITADDARAIALHHAGLKEVDVVYVKTNLDSDDGCSEYEIEFCYGDHEYDYDIDAVTGTIHSFDTKIDSKHHDDSHHNASSSASAQASSAQSVSGASITESEAQKIALEHAGVSTSDAAFVRIELDRDDGRLEYEIEFRANGMEYEYEIDAESGKILKSEKDHDD